MTSLRAVVAEPAARIPSDRPSGFQYRPPLAADRLLSDILFGKKVCIIIDDVDHDQMKKMAHDLFGKEIGLNLLPWSSVSGQLPDVRADVLVIISPRTLSEGFEFLPRMLEQFKKDNPGSTTVMSNLHHMHSKETEFARQLGKTSLVDFLGEGYTPLTTLFDKAAQSLS